LLIQFICFAARYENTSGTTFTPSARAPALQYLDSVEPGSVADKAGLAAGDFLLEVSGRASAMDRMPIIVDPYVSYRFNFRSFYSRPRPSKPSILAESKKLVRNSTGG
jgi:PDZ domain